MTGDYVFDDNNGDKAQGLTLSNSVVPNHLLLISTLEQLCFVYSKGDTKQGQDVFKCTLYNNIIQIKVTRII